MKRTYQVLALIIVAIYIYQEYQVRINHGSNQQSETKTSYLSNQSRINQAGLIDNYRTARKIFWNQLYANGGITLYCRERFSNNVGQGINVEHIFPMSWVTKSLACGTRNQCRQGSEIFNFIEADIHNLFPARTDVNEDRSSFRFGVVKGEVRRYGKSCDFETDPHSRVAEPTKEVRGDIARAMFYMAYRYKQNGLILFSSQGSTLFQWHLSDPPNDFERFRNSEIEALQGNKNIFIDNPQKLVELVESGYFY